MWLSGDKKVMFFGHLRSRKEMFINGVIFILINAAYSIFSLLSQLQEGFVYNKNSGFEDLVIQSPSTIITVIFMLIGYILIDRAVFGDNVNVLTKKYGIGGFFLLKFSLAISIILVYLLLQIITLLFIL